VVRLSRSAALKASSTNVLDPESAAATGDATRATEEAAGAPAATQVAAEVRGVVRGRNRFGVVDEDDPLPGERPESTCV
jgi:hypothetical protein